MQLSPNGAGFFDHDFFSYQSVKKQSSTINVLEIVLQVTYKNY